MSLVLDCSATLAWIYSDETTPAIRRVFDQVVETGAWVPSIWRLEVANVLEIGVRRRRTNAAFLEATLRDLSLLTIRQDTETFAQAWGTTLHLARHYRLTLYDAAYLEVAKRRNLPLATLDDELRKAALAENVALLGVD